MLEKPKLFLNVKQFWLTLFILALLLFSRLFFLHQEYVEFKSKPFFYTTVDVIQAYEKWNKDEYHTILKLYSPVLDLHFFSRTKLRAIDISSRIRVKIFPHKKMSFRDFLGTSFMFTKVNEVYENKKNIKNKMFEFIENQHENTQLSNFYKAIYFATSLDKSLRTQVSTLGVSHLIALSGFHLAILSTVLFFLLRVLYRPLQQKFFPYRFDLFDVGFLVLLLLGWYVWFVDAPPSLVRSYAMMFVGWILLVLGMELLSFTFLTTIVLLLLIIFPKMLLSLAFWFSVSGVFYIFLLLHYFSHVNKYIMTLLITFGIFVLMLPIVHMVFPITSPLQLISPFLSLLFTFFYPLSMLLHLLGFGNLFDSYLLALFTLEAKEELFKLSLFYGTGYVVLSVLAIFYKPIFYFLSLTAFSFFLWLFMGFWV